MFSGGISGVEAETPLLRCLYRVYLAVSIPEQRFFEKAPETPGPFRFSDTVALCKPPALSQAARVHLPDIADIWTVSQFG
jgi:hypothetical protein